MKKSRLLGAVCLCALTVICTSSNAATITIFSDRSSFLSSTGTSIVDDYENSNYEQVMTDIEMSAVLGETEYYTYGGNVTNYNNVQGWPGYASNAYCSLCYGSFVLSFIDTSLSEANGVYGAGIDIATNTTSTEPYYKYSAKVTFGDGSVNIFELPHVGPGWPPTKFWGITSDAGIFSIDFMGYSSTTGDPNRTYLVIDNLTITASPVPIPAAVWLFGSGLLGLIGIARRRKPSRTPANTSGGNTPVHGMNTPEQRSRMSTPDKSDSGASLLT